MDTEITVRPVLRYLLKILESHPTGDAVVTKGSEKRNISQQILVGSTSEMDQKIDKDQRSARRGKKNAPWQDRTADLRITQGLSED